MIEIIAGAGGLPMRELEPDFSLRHCFRIAGCKIEPALFNYFIGLFLKDNAN